MKAEYISHMGSDDGVADAARVSFDKLAEMFTPEQNTSLIYFLARGCSSKDWKSLIEMLIKETDYNTVESIVKQIRLMGDHWTPFAHTAIKLRMQAPVPIRTHC